MLRAPPASGICITRTKIRGYAGLCLTPVEQAFSTTKTALLWAEARAREVFDEAITAAVAMITAIDAHGWFARCGYPIPAQLT